MDTSTRLAEIEAAVDRNDPIDALELIAMVKEARDRIAALEGELELARQGQRDARAGMDYAISKGRGEAANFCARIDALLKERDEARRELKQAREQIHAQGRELVVAIESLRSAREVIDRRDRHGEEMEERIAALERKNTELTRPKREWIATNGEDLNGYDFGCEWVWLKHRSFKKLGLLCVQERSLIKDWSVFTHYMPTDIRTPEPPEEEQ